MCRFNFMNKSKTVLYTLPFANEWRAIAPVLAHTYQYLFRCAAIAHAILCMRNQSHYNTSTSVFNHPP